MTSNLEDPVGGWVLLGAGGHAHAVAAIMRAAGCGPVLGVLDDGPADPGEAVAGWPIMGGVNHLPAMMARGVRRAALGVGDNEIRRRLYERCVAAGLECPVIRHPAAVVEAGATLGAGTVIAAGAVVGATATLGIGCIVNTGASVDHEVALGDFGQIGPGARVGGRCVMGDGCTIGIGAVVIDRLTIGKGTVVGAGAVVVRSLPGHVVAYGVPAKPRRPVRRETVR